MPKENVVSFRFDDKKFGDLSRFVEGDQPPIGIKSPNQMARKVVSDFLSGRLAYSNPEDLKTDFDYIKAGT